MKRPAPAPRGPLLWLWAIWDRYWFAPEPAVCLVLLRLVTFGTLCYFALHDGAYLVPLPHLDPWFYRPLPLFELLGIGPLPAALAVPLRWALALGAVAGLVGAYARWTAALCAVLYAYAIGQLYSFTSVHHGDALLLLGLVACAATPCDALFAPRLPGQRGPLAVASSVAGWPVRLVRVQVALTYWLAGYAKLVLGGPGWADGATLQYYLLLRGQPLGWWVAARPELCLLLSAGSLLWELTFPLVLVWPRLAWVYVPAALAFHLGSQTLLALGFYHFFPFLLLFVEPRALVRWLRAWQAATARSPAPEATAAWE